VSYTIKNLNEVEDSAPKHGYSELQEARFPREDVGTEASGLAHIKVKPGQRQPFAHKHGEAEELHLIIAGSGTMKVDDELIEVGPLDVIRVDPASARAFEAGGDGLEYVVFSPRHGGDAEIVEDFWGPNAE
jgi:mannose-6-phosphate isomerase-like protein (cupin superfamily)